MTTTPLSQSPQLKRAIAIFFFDQCLHLLLWIFTNVSRTKGFTYDLEQVISSGLKPQKKHLHCLRCASPTWIKPFLALGVIVCLGSTICHCVKSGSELLYLMCLYLILSLMSNLLLSSSPHVCGGRCCVGWMLSPKTRRCTKREWRRQRYFCPVFEYSLSYMFWNGGQTRPVCFPHMTVKFWKCNNFSYSHFYTLSPYSVLQAILCWLCFTSFLRFVTNLCILKMKLSK